MLAARFRRGAQRVPQEGSLGELERCLRIFRARTISPANGSSSTPAARPWDAWQLKRPACWPGKPQVHALYRHGRSRHRGQCGEDCADRPQEPAKGLSPLYRISRWVAGRVVCAPDGAPAGKDCRRRHQRHAAEEQDGPEMGTKLKVYRGDKHPHQAQQPEVYELAAR